MDFIVPQNIEIEKKGIVIKAQKVVMASMVNGISFHWASSLLYPTFFFSKLKNLDKDPEEKTVMPTVVS